MESISIEFVFCMYLNYLIELCWVLANFWKSFWCEISNGGDTLLLKLKQGVNYLKWAEGLMQDFQKFREKSWVFETLHNRKRLFLETSLETVKIGFILKKSFAKAFSPCFYSEECLLHSLIQRVEFLMWNSFF